jgi:hypothetical protein
MSRFNFNNVISQSPDIDPILPKFNDQEICELLKNCEFSSPDKELIESILNDGVLKSLNELYKIFDAHEDNIFYKSFKPNSAASLRDAADYIDLFNDLNMIMCLDRNVTLEESKKFIFSEIRIVQITENTKRMVLAISVNTQQKVTHDIAWGYQKNKKNENKKQEGEGGYENGF